MELIVNPSRLGDRLKDGFKEVTERAHAFHRRAEKLSTELTLQLLYRSLYNQGGMSQNLEDIHASMSSINQKLTREELFKLFDPLLQTITEKGQYDLALQIRGI